MCIRDRSLEGNLAGFEAGERFYEIGSPEGLDDLEKRLTREGGLPALRH